MRKYRFFFHYYRQYKCMSLHFKGRCYKVDEIVCNVTCETHWRNTMPHLVMRGFAKSVQIVDGVATIS